MSAASTRKTHNKRNTTVRGKDFKTATTGDFKRPTHVMIKHNWGT